MADLKLSALTEISVPALEDLLYTVDDPAGTPASNKVSATRFLGQMVGACQGRLTLSSGNSVYSPDRSLTPSATSTVNDTVDFSAAHLWTTGTMVTVDATGGGLTADTVYYINAADSDTISFHTTVAAAEAGSSKVDLTASITAAVIPLGVSRTSVYFTPHGGNRVALYDGTRWRLYSFSEITLALGTLTASRNYDVFLYDNAGTLTLELSAAWGTVAGGLTRTDALALQDGVWCKSGALTRRYVGTLRTDSTTTTLLLWAPPSGTTAKMFLWNAQNRILHHASAIEDANSWTYTLDAWASLNSDDTNRVEFVLGLDSEAVQAMAVSHGSNSASEWSSTGIGLNSTTANHARIRGGSAMTSSYVVPSTADYRGDPGPGYHYLQQLQRSVAGGTTTWYGDNGATIVQAGLSAEVWL